MRSTTSDEFDVTILTPTTGRPSLQALIESVDAQRGGLRIQHLLLWDDKRAPGAPPAEAFREPRRWSLVLPGSFGKIGEAPGSALRAVGLMAAVAPWVTFADDDIRWEPTHLQSLLAAAAGCEWASTLRCCWSPDGTRLGVDRFESVGDAPGRRVPYEMCDNNCMLIRRERGVAAASLYRETTGYNDDRLLYAFMKQHAGRRGTTGVPTVHQISPPHLVEFFRAHCDPA